jgi:hypothetical protein
MPARAVLSDPADTLAEIVTVRRRLCDEHVAVEDQASHLEDAMLCRMASGAHRGGQPPPRQSLGSSITSSPAMSSFYRWQADRKSPGLAYISDATRIPA